MKYLFVALIGLFISCNAQDKKSDEKKGTIEKSTKSEKMNTIYNYTFEDINGDQFNFADLKGKKVLIVNTASKCGFTKQYETLEAIYQKYKDQNFVVVGFPSDNFMGQEFDDNAEIAKFCKLNYGVTFPLMTKSDVKGENQNEVFKFLTEKKLNGKEDATVGWNFHKFLINSDGTLEADFPSKVTPDSPEIISWIEKN